MFLFCYISWLFWRFALQFIILLFDFVDNKTSLTLLLHSTTQLANGFNFSGGAAEIQGARLEVERLVVY